MTFHTAFYFRLSLKKGRKSWWSLNNVNSLNVSFSSYSAQLNVKLQCQSLQLIQYLYKHNASEVFDKAMTIGAKQIDVPASRLVLFHRETGMYQSGFILRTVEEKQGRQSNHSATGYSEFVIRNLLSFKELNSEDLCQVNAPISSCKLQYYWFSLPSHMQCGSVSKLSVSKLRFGLYFSQSASQW